MESGKHQTHQIDTSLFDRGARGQLCRGREIIYPPALGISREQCFGGIGYGRFHQITMRRLRHKGNGKTRRRAVAFSENSPPFLTLGKSHSPENRLRGINVGENSISLENSPAL